MTNDGGGAMRVFRLALRRPRTAAAEMDEEVRFHIEARVDQLVRLGWQPDDARAEALRRFGSYEQTLVGLRRAARDRERRLRMAELVHDLWQDLRFGTRMLRRYPAFAAAATITLAVGIGAASAMFAVVRHSLLAPLPYAGQDRLMFVAEDYGKHSPTLVSYPNFADWRAQARSFETLEAVGYPNAAPVLGGDEPAMANVQNVSSGMFRMLGVRPLVGRWISPDENRLGAEATVVVSEDFWRQHLGANPNLANVKLDVWGRPRAVVGVMPAGFRVLEPADIWFPLETSPVRIRGAGNYWVIGKVRPGVTFAAARAELNGIAARLEQTYGDQTLSRAVVAMPLIDWIVGDARTPLLILLGAAVFVLLVTCVNVAMMLIARGNARMREMAVRVALGSGRWRLMRQSVAETLIFVTLGSVGGVLIAWAGTVAIRTLGTGQLPRLNELHLDAGVVAFAVLVAAIAAAVFSAIPARAARRATSDALGSSAKGSRPSRSWSVLVAVQAAAAVLLVVGASLIVRSVENILNVDTGYDPRSVSAAFIPLTSSAYGSDTARELAGERIMRDMRAALPGATVALGSALPVGRASANGPLLLPPITDPTSPKSWAAIGSTRYVTPSYFAALRIRLLKGRLFDGGDRQGSMEVAIVNQSLAAKLWPGQNPIGKRVRPLVDQRGALFTVVGVVADARDWRRPAGSQLDLFVPFAQRPTSYVYALARTSEPEAAVTSVMRRVLHAMDPNIPPVLFTLQEDIKETMSDRRFVAMMLVSFATAVLLLTIVGTAGSVSYAVTMRTREIGIRLAVGATPASIWLGVERSMLAVVAVGAAAGLAVAWVTSRVLAGLLFGLGTHDVTSFGVAPVLVCAAGVAAAAWPGFRASRTDPSMSLRAE